MLQTEEWLLSKFTVPTTGHTFLILGTYTEDNCPEKCRCCCYRYAKGPVAEQVFLKAGRIVPLSDFAALVEPGNPHENENRPFDRQPVR
jgi:hypothetical protein